MKRSRQTETPDVRRKRRQRAAKTAYKSNLQRRLAFIFIVVAAALLVLSVVLIRIVRTRGDDYSRTVLTQQNYSSATIAFRRGDITDRNGSLLATSERVYIMILDPSVILSNSAVNEAATLEALNTVYGYDTAELAELIEANPESRYIRYTRDLKEEEKDAFLTYQTEYNARDSKERNGRVSGVWFETEYKRAYPMNDFACTVLGFSGRDASRGNWGLEEYYNDELTGTNGLTYGYINGDGVAERNTVEPVNGHTVVSTIDYSVQTIVEDTIKAFTAERECANLGIIVMDPNNGEILALATDKYYDLNDPTELSAYYTEEEFAALTAEEQAEARAKIWRNFAIADAFEPGSTAKPFTVAAALEEAATDAEHSYECTGAKVFGTTGHEVTVKCNQTHGVVTLEQSLMYSCNSAMMDIVENLGKEKFVNFQTTFGFGRQTGVDLPGETAGIVYTAENMGVTDLATNGFGQNFNVNMVQMAAAFSSLINGGNYYQPHIVKAITNENGEVLKEITPTLVRRTVSEETCNFIKEALLATVQDGTGAEAAIEGYEIGGKTGTAQKHPRSAKKYVTSFVGFAPADDPKVLVYVVIDDLTLLEDERISTKYAIELERTVMEKILPYLGVPNANPVVAPVLPMDPDQPQAEQVPDDGILSGDDDDGAYLTQESDEE